MSSYAGLWGDEGMAKKKALPNWWGDGPELKPEIFSAGDVAAILQIPDWRLRNFLSGRAFKISAMDKIGQGRGSRHLFNREGVYRIGVAMIMLNDGFNPERIGHVMENLDESTFNELDPKGKHIPFFLTIKRQGSKRIGEVIATPPEVSFWGNGAYYVLDLSKLATDINQRIAAWRKSQ